MKIRKRYLLIVILISILSLAMFFALKPNYWLRIADPLQYEIVSVDTHIENQIIDLELGMIVNSDYFLDIVLDSIEYKISMESVLFSQGKKVFKKNYKFGEDDTLFLPLKIELAKIKNVIKNNQHQDSLSLVINFTNYLQLPFTGNTTFDISINKQIVTPNPPKITVLNIEKKKLKLHDAIYEITFQIQNNNHHTINIQGLVATIEYPNLFLGKIKSNKSFVILPHATITTQAEIDIDNLNLVVDGLRIIMQPKKEWPYNLDALLNIKKADGSIMPVHISNSGTMPLKKKKK